MLVYLVFLHTLAYHESYILEILIITKSHIIHIRVSLDTDFGKEKKYLNSMSIFFFSFCMLTDFSETAWPIEMSFLHITGHVLPLIQLQTFNAFLFFVNHIFFCKIPVFVYVHRLFGIGLRNRNETFYIVKR